LYRVIFNFGYVKIDPYWHIILPLVSLIFLSIGYSFAASRKMKWFPATIVAIIFAAVADVISYFIYNVVYTTVTYQGQTLAQRFPHGTEYPIIIYAYGFMLMLAFVFGTIYLVTEGKREKISSDVILDMMVFIIIGSIIGARIIYILLMPEEFKPIEIAPGQLQPAAPWWDITRGGLSVHGGIMGALLAGIIFCKIRRLSFWKMADFTIVAVPLGIFFGRIGCYLNGCCFGTPFDNQAAASGWWWAKYPTVAVPENTIPPYPMDGLFRHPAPLYEAFAALAFFFYLRYFYRNKSRFTGHTFLVFVFGYSIIRFLQENYRFDVSSKVIGTWLTYAQLASLILILISGVIMFEINRRINIAERLTEELTGEEEEEEEEEEEPVKPSKPVEREAETDVETEDEDEMDEDFIEEPDSAPDEETEEK
jgi:phosphatidylglycerol:prolipoprotein diacylglycerol transferase